MRSTRSSTRQSSQSGASGSGDDDEHEVMGPPPPPNKTKPPPKKGRSKQPAPAAKNPKPKVLLAKNANANVANDEDANSNAPAAANEKSNPVKGGKGKRGALGLRKAEIWDNLADLMQESQFANSIQRRKLYKKFQKEFYAESDPTLVNDYQKYFAQSLWRMSLCPFREPNSPGVDKTLKFLRMIFSECGTDADKEEIGFNLNTYPVFYYILKLIIQSHMDERRLVRQRVMEVLLLILELHGAHECLANGTALRDHLSAICGVRLRDKQHQVRGLAAKALKYFMENERSILKDLKYYSRYDPSGDVRKAAISALKDHVSTKVTFLYEHAFDQDSNVRVEAFSSLATKSMAALPFDKREKVLYWGLNQEGKVKKIVTEKLLPAWFEECGKDPVALLKMLGIATKANMSFTVLSHLYADDRTETFEAIDRSFLNEENIIPLEKLTTERVMFWIFMMKYFGNTRYHLEKLSPNPDLMASYINSIIDAIRDENLAAQAEDRDEDCTLLVCLTYIVTIGISVGLEEGTRRSIEDVIKTILLDPILDESVLIKCAVDAMKKLDPNPATFTEKMMEVFQQVFDPNEKTLLQQTPRRRRRSGRPSSAASARPGSRNGSSAPAPLTPKTPRYFRNSESAEPEPMEVDPSAAAETKDQDPEHDKPDNKPQRPPPLTEQELVALRDKACTLALKRYRLGEEKTAAIKASNFLEAHRLQALIDSILAEEKDIRVKIQTPQSSFAEISTISTDSRHPPNGSLPMSNRNGERSASASHTSKNSSRLGVSASTHDSTLGEGESGIGMAPESRPQGLNLNETVDTCSQATNVDAQLGISSENLLKGLIMLTRYLCVSPKLTPFVRELYEKHTPKLIMDDEGRIRSQTLYFLCITAKIEPCEKRKVMSLLIKGLEGEQDLDVRRSAFKSIIDLLLHYKISDFKPTAEEDLQDDDDLPEIYNNLEATTVDIEEMFAVLLDDYGSDPDMDIPEVIGEKITGLIKLLHCGRLKSKDLIADLMCMWINKKYAGTSVPYNVGMWIPAYTKNELCNAQLVAKALQISLKRIINAQDDHTDLLSDSDYTKLIDFFPQFLAPGYLDMPGGEKIHEELFLDILDGIMQHLSWTGNSVMMKLTTKLFVATEEGGRQLGQAMQLLMLKINTYPQTATMASLKTAVKGALQKLAKQFTGMENMIDVGNQIRISSDTSGDEDEEERGPFSDDDGPSIMSSRHASTSSNLPVPHNRIGLPSTSDQSDDSDMNDFMRIVAEEMEEMEM